MARAEGLQGFGLQLGDYSRLPDILDKQAIPFHAVKRRKGNQLLGFYGIYHHADLSHPDFELLGAEFSQFETRTRGSNRIIVIEGRNVEEIGEDRHSINRGRAQHHRLIDLARQYQIPTVSGEPEPLADEARLVVPRFSKYGDPDYGRKLGFYYYSARVLTQYARIPEKERTTPEAYMDEWFKICRTTWKWNNFDFTYDNLHAISEELYEKPFDPMETDFLLHQTVNYGRFVTPVQQFAQEVNKIRDSVPGYTHLELLEPGITESYLPYTNEIGKYCIAQARRKREFVDQNFGEGPYSTFDSHGYFHSAVLEPVFNTWGVSDL